MDPNKWQWAESISYAGQDCVISGEAYYDVHELSQSLEESTVAIIKRKFFRIYEKSRCFDLYGIDIKDTQFCGKSRNKMTFFEVRE